MVLTVLGNNLEFVDLKQAAESPTTSTARTLSVSTCASILSKTANARKPKIGFDFSESLACAGSDEVVRRLHSSARWALKGKVLARDALAAQGTSEFSMGDSYHGHSGISMVGS